MHGNQVPLPSDICLPRLSCIQGLSLAIQNFYANLPPFSLPMTLIPLILLWHNTSATTPSRQLKEGIIVLIVKSKEGVWSLALFVLGAT